MTADSARAGGPSWRTRLGDAFAGLSWPAVAVTLLLCLYSALNDTLNFLPDISLSHWLLDTAKNWATTVLAAIPVLLGSFAAWNRFPSPGRRQWQALAAAVLVGSALGVAVKLPLDLMLFDVTDDFGGAARVPRLYFQFYVQCLTLAGLFAGAHALHLHEARRMEALHQADIERVRLDEQADEARLQVLQAQIEPHFLFNTLANVRRLYATEPATAAAMLDNLMRYLSAALPQMRSAESTLEREMHLAEAYLDIQKVRMGGRLVYAIDVPATLRQAPMPPMMLLTLVENAVKHGVGPLPEGGDILIRAREAQGQLHVEVSDSGRGFTHSSGSGTGLANVRGRLQALHGSAARLVVLPNHPRGSTVAIALPREPARGSS